MGFIYLGNFVGLLALCQVLPWGLSAPADTDLFLTPMIKSGDLEKARQAAADSAKLSHVKSDKEVKSFSGYLTIDEATESNLFFWFFPAQENPGKAPVILWINEIPGFSSLKGVFLETGPFEVDDNNALKERKTTWTKTHSMLYIDAPVGTGFSFAKDESAYANNSDDEAQEIHEALKQFFTLFEEFSDRDFYMAGESYAASFIPYIAKKIDSENGKGGMNINLKGLVVGSPFLDTDQLQSAEDLYNFGLLDAKQKKEMKEKTDEAIDLIKQGKIAEGTKLGWDIYLNPGSLWQNFSGFADIRNALDANEPAEINKFVKFVDSKEVHNYLHVGLHKYVGINEAVFKHFVADLVGSHIEVMQEMLDKGYRVLLYAPQFDLLMPQAGITRMLEKVKWKGADNFMKAPRKIWKVKDEVAGYIKMADNFVYAVVRNSGNYAIMDQPEWIFDLVEKFLYNKEF